MAEETPVASAPAPVADAAPAPAAPVPAVLSESPAPAAAPEVAPVAETPAAPAPEAPAPDAPAAPAPEGEPVAEVPAPVEGEKPAEPAAEAAPAPEPPKYAELLKVPEGLTMAPDQMTGYAALLTKFNLTPEAGQEMMDFGGAFLKQAQENLVQNQHDVFAETRRGFVAEAQKTFGNKFDTTVNDAKFAITSLVPDKKARAELWSVLSFTGAGDNRHVIGAFAAAGKILRERAAPGPSNPVNGTKSGNPAERRYAGSTPKS